MPSMQLLTPLLALIVAAPVIVVGIADRAMAGGSVALSDVLTLTKSVPDLGKAVQKAADDANEDTGQVACDAVRIGNQYPLIGGERIGPYSCPIGDKVLEVESTVDLLDENGNVIDKSDEDSLRAASVREKDFKWTLRKREK